MCHAICYYIIVILPWNPRDVHFPSSYVMVRNGGDISSSIISMIHNLIHILIRILILLLGELLVLLIFIELLTNQGPLTGIQGMATAAKSEKKK